MNTGMGGANAPPVYSLAVIVYQQLAAVDTAAADRYQQLYNAFADYSQGEDNPIDTQNRFWRIQLASLSVNTVVPRQYLQMRDIVAWLSDFQKVLLPIIVRYQLPQRLDHAKESCGG